jgi:hypothetical protein
MGIMSNLERSRQSVQKVALALSDLPELNSTQDRFHLNHQVVPTEVAYNFGIIFVEYLKIVRDLSCLSETELVYIHQANELSSQRGRQKIKTWLVPNKNGKKHTSGSKNK